MPGYVAHLDADCFYVSAERVRHQGKRMKYPLENAGVQRPIGQ